MCMVFDMLGDNLLTLIKAYRYQGIPSLIVRKLTRQVAEALDFLHRHCRVIHTDLKPENVLLTGKVRWRVVACACWECAAKTRCCCRTTDDLGRFHIRAFTLPLE